LLSYFERCLNSTYLISRIENLLSQSGLYVHPEFALWATSCTGVVTSKKSYETLETYGDTILKLAASILAYN
jgi:hypothetical protein